MRIDFISRLVGEYHPTHLVCCWDNDWRPAWRVELIPTYKAHRVVEQPLYALPARRGEASGHGQLVRRTAELGAQLRRTAAVLPQVLPGDLDRDGSITEADLRQLIAEIFDGDGDAVAAAGGGAIASGAEADVNGDAHITAADLAALSVLRR